MFFCPVCSFFCPFCVFFVPLTICLLCPALHSFVPVRFFLVPWCFFLSRYRLTTGSPWYGNADIAMCPPVSHAAGKGFTGIGVFDGSGASLEASLRELAVRQTDQFAILTNSIASIQRQLSELNDITSRTQECMHAQQARSANIDKNPRVLACKHGRLAVSLGLLYWNEERCFRLARAKGCRIFEVRFEQTAFSEPHSRRECRHFPASREKAKAILLASTEGTRRMAPTRRRVPSQCCSCQFSLWSEQGLCPEVLCCFLSLILIKIPTRSSARRAATMTALRFIPKQRVSRSLQPIRVKGSFSLPKTLWQRACPLMFLFAKPGTLMSARWGSVWHPSGLCLISASPATLSHTRNPTAPVVDKKKARVCVVDGLSGFTMSIFKIVMERGSHVFKVHAKAELPGNSAEELEELLATARAPPVGTLSFDPCLGCTRVFSSVVFSCLPVRFCSASLALIFVPVFPRGPVSLYPCRSSGPAPWRATFLQPLWALVSTSHFRCGQISHLVLVAFFFKIVIFSSRQVSSGL